MFSVNRPSYISVRFPSRKISLLNFFFDQMTFFCSFFEMVGSGSHNRTSFVLIVIQPSRQLYRMPFYRIKSFQRKFISPVFFSINRSFGQKKLYKRSFYRKKNSTTYTHGNLTEKVIDRKNGGKGMIDA
jgi:hypothetical protein